MPGPVLRRVSTAMVLVVIASTMVIGAVAAPSPAGAAVLDVDPVATGDDHSCALTATGGVRCWGANASGQLGDGTTVSSAVPVDVLGLTSGVVSIAAGSAHTCAILTTGALRCWGANSSGQLGDGRTVNALVSVPVKGMTTGVTAVTAGSAHTCALTTVGAAWCWGRNSEGELGIGSKTGSSEPVEVIGLAAGTRDIAAGSSHTCAVTPAGAATCWGDNFTGESNPNGGMGSVLSPVVVAGAASGVTAVSAGGSHSCALLASTAVTCWGSNSSRQLGRDADGHSVPPGVVPGLSDVTSLSAGKRHQCAVAGGQAVCWGDNNLAQGGLDLLRRWSPVTPVPGLVDVQAISTSEEHTCALEAAGTLTCFGVNDFGQLGVGESNRWTRPKAVPGLGGAATQVVTSGQSACALVATQVRCWGSNRTAAIGAGVDAEGLAYLEYAVATTVPGLPPVQSLAAGSGHICALTTEGAVWCWGSRSHGQTGDGTSSSLGNFSPVPVTGLSSGVASITAGGEHTCAVTNAGAARCWGRNHAGQLGDGTTTYSPVPVAVAGLPGPVSELEAGAAHTCAITTAGALWCWGQNEFGQLGNDTQVSSLAPVPVNGLPSGVVDVSLGQDHSCAVVDGLARCWGLGADGRLGQGSSGGSGHPFPPEQAASPAAEVSLGGDHACALTSTGAVRCWGANSFGQLGIGNLVGAPLSGPVTLPAAATDISAGTGTTCAVLATGGVSCWGRNEFSQLGIGTRQRVLGGATFSTGNPAVWYPFASWTALVKQVYVDLTGKAPTSSELSSWVSLLTAGTTSKGDLAATLRTGPDNLVNVDATTRLYRAFLGRAPDRDGLLFWIGRRRAGTWKLVRMADSFAGSTEFKRRYGTLSNKAFVTLIYTDVMGRTADPGGVAYWTGKLDSGASSRGGVMVGFSESNEYKRKQAFNTDVAVGHILLLRRVASSPETIRWTTLQTNGVTNSDLLLELLDTREFARRFQP